MRATGSRERLLAKAQRHCGDDLNAMLSALAHAEGLMLDYQYAWLYALAQPYDGGRIVEIGTYKGKSALVLALACPRAQIISLTMHATEAREAARALAGHQVDIHVAKSWDYLAEYAGPELDLVFVDGDHTKVTWDLAWFNWLRVGGLLLLHDWSPVGTPSVQACYSGINTFAANLGRSPDVQIVDIERVGMAGFYRRAAEVA